MPWAVAAAMPALRADYLVPPERTIADAAGGVGFPWRRLDTLSRMARGEVITPALERWPGRRWRNTRPSSESGGN